MAWDVRSAHGIQLPQIGWALDPAHASPRAFVSHGHSDHIGRHREVICTYATARFMRARLAGRRTEHILPFGQTEQLTPDCTATLHPAGHIFGSAQILLDHASHGRLLYTGDFKLHANALAERCATPRADVLIMETTFGLPRYVFPPYAETSAAIIAFCQKTLADGAIPILHAYSLGKTQELLKILQPAALPIMLHGESHRLTRLHEQLGCTFPPYRELVPEEARGHVVIAPPFGKNSLLREKLRPARIAAVTGWALDASAIYRLGCDVAFPLSDHADYAELLLFVKQVQPRLVYTVHGFAREFAATLRNLGCEAWALGAINQLDLFACPSSPASPSSSP